MLKETSPVAPQLPKKGFSQLFIDLANSAIVSDIISQNFQLLQGDSAYARLLYALDQKECRRNDGRLKSTWLNRYKHLDHGGWWCNGIDLTTGKDSEWGCFKPFRPRSINGKLIKYEHPPQAETEVLALKVTPTVFDNKFKERFSQYPKKEAESFWDWVINNPVPIIITEGAKKTASLLSAGFPAIGLAGIWNFFDKEGELNSSIRRLSETSREFIICFDKDTKWATRQDVFRATKKLGEALLKLESYNSVSVLHWEAEEGKGIDDVIFHHLQGRLEEIYEQRLTLEEYLERYFTVKELKKPQLLEFVSRYLSKELAFNTLTQRIEYKGKNLELSGELVFWLIEEFGVTASVDAVISAIAYVAKKNTYSPVQKYLKSCLNKEAVPIDNLATRYFKTDNPLYDIFLKKWLIGAVARAFQPGCKVETALILQGKTGIGKSTFFKTLGGQFFDDSFGDNIESTKGLMVLHKSWIQEWSEFERVSTKREFNVIKAFLSRCSDCFVAPYGRDAVDHPRTTVLCGTVNPTDILRDETGNRRFWVVPIPKELEMIDTDLLAKERDGLWKSAILEFQKGNIDGKPPWILTREEEKLSVKNNEPFRVTDEWEPLIETHLQNLETTSITDLLDEIFDIEPARQDRKTQVRVANILVKLGWTKGKRLTNSSGQKRYFWLAPQESCPQSIPFSGDGPDSPEDSPRRIVQPEASTDKGCSDSDYPDYLKSQTKKVERTNYKPGELVLQISSNKSGEVYRDEGESCYVFFADCTADVLKTDLIHKQLLKELGKQNGKG